MRLPRIRTHVQLMPFRRCPHRLPHRRRRHTVLRVV